MEQIQNDLKTVFDSFDKNKNGTLQKAEIKQVFLQLGYQIPQKQLFEIMESLDINEDGKISFKQFRIWWENGVKGKMKSLVVLQGKGLRLATFASKLIKQKYTDHNSQEGQNIQNYSYSTQFGDNQDSNLDLNIQIFIKGDKFHKRIEQLAQQYVDFKHNFSNFAATLYFSKPQQGKKLIEKFINRFSQKIEKDSGLKLEQFMKINLNVSHNCLTICISSTKITQQMIKETIQDIRKEIDNLGEQFIFHLVTQLNLDGTIQQLQKCKNTIDALHLGFKYFFKLETNKNIINIIKYQLFGQKQKFPFSKEKNISKLLKNKQQIEQFMKQINLKQQEQNLGIILLITYFFTGFLTDAKGRHGQQIVNELYQGLKLLFCGQQFKAQLCAKFDVVLCLFSFKTKQAEKLFEQIKK